MAKFNVVIREPEGYKPLYVNGAQGGATLQGEVIINFTLERTPVPTGQTMEVSDIGVPTIIETLPKDIQTMIIRTVTTGVIMNLQTAKTIHNWLGTIIPQLENVIIKK